MSLELRQEDIQIQNLSLPSEPSAFHAINGVAIRLLREKYQFLIQELVTILLDQNDLRSYDALAQELIPQEYDQNSVVAKKIIHLAAQTAAQQYNESAEEPTIDLYARSCRVKSFTNINRRSGHTMLEALGRKPFSLEEIGFILNLISNPDFQWRTGSHAGQPDWCKITIAFNNNFADQRTAKSLSDQIKTMRYNGDSRLQAAQELELEEHEEESSIFYIDRFLQRIIIEKELYERFASQIAYILNDLSDYRSYHEIVRDLMPEEYSYGYNAANQLISTIIDLIRFDSSIDFNEDLFQQRKIVINVHRKRLLDQAGAMLERQGIIRFSEAEFKRFMELRRLCVREDGPQVGRTDYIQVARQLNNEFHEDSETRTAEKLSGLVRAYRQNFKKKPYMYPNIDDFNVPIEEIVNAYYLPQVTEQ